jgi:two-component system, NarL family, sensor histidine kinase DesK
MRSIDGAALQQRKARDAGGRSVYFASLVWLVWLLYMIPVIGSLLTSHPSALRLIASLLGAAVFVAIYVWTGWQNARQVVGAARPPIARSALRTWLPVLAMLALSIVLTNVDGPGWGALFIYTCAAAGGRLVTREAAALLLSVMLLSLLYAWQLHLPSAVALGNLFSLGLAGVTTITMVFAVTTSRRWRDEREELMRFAAVTEERLRIARDLHDLLGHNLSVIALKSELAGRLVLAAPERAAAEIGDIERVARTALQEVREAVAGYRQPTLASELRGAREVLAAAGIAYRIEGDDGGLTTLPAPVDAALAWTVREGITNVVRHSGARRCEVLSAREAGEVRVEVTDDGSRVVAEQKGQQASVLVLQPGNGLRGLAERVEALGGRFEAGPRPEGGFRLAVAIPLDPGKQQRASNRTAIEEHVPRGPVVAPAQAVETGEKGATP